VWGKFKAPRTNLKINDQYTDHFEREIVMKHTKKLLAILLSFVLLLGLAVPAMAEEVRYNLYVPWEGVTITYPRASSDSPYQVAYGKSFTLAIEATLPNDVEISYQWWYGTVNDGMVPIEGEIASRFTSSPGDIHYPNPSNTSNPDADKPFARQRGAYACDITLVKKDASGVVVDTYEASITTLFVEVKAERDMTFWEKIWYVGIIGGWEMSLMVGIFTFGIGFLAFPVVFPIAVIISLLIGGTTVY